MVEQMDEAIDREWSRAGYELDYGSELVIEWGVQFSRPGGFHVSLYGGSDDDEAAAREFVGNFTPRGEGQTVAVVARRVLYGAWGERDVD